MNEKRFFPDELVADGCLPPDGWKRDMSKHGWVPPEEWRGGSTHTHLCPAFSESIAAGRSVTFIPSFFLGRWFLTVNEYARSIRYCPWCGQELKDPKEFPGG